MKKYQLSEMEQAIIFVWALVLGGLMFTVVLMKLCP